MSTLVLHLSIIGEIRGVYLKVDDRELVKRKIRQEFKSFTPSVGEEFYE